MERKINLKKIASVLLTLVVTISMILPSMLVPKEVSAASENINITYSNDVHYNGTTTGGYSFYGASSQIYATSGNYYCLDAPKPFHPGTYDLYDLVGFKGLTQAEVTQMALAVKYVESNYSGVKGYNIAQGIVWELSGGKLFNMSSISFTGLPEYESAKAAALSYANSNSSTYKGKGYLATGGNQPVARFEVEITTGYAQLKKVTKSNKHLTDLCPEQYSIAGATYGVYADSACTSAVNSFVTDESGNSNVVKLKPTVHYVKETKAPKGYKLDPTVYTLDVKAGKTTVLNVADEPVLDPLGWKLITKKIEDGADKNLSPQGAEFEAKFYNTLGDITGKTPLKTWTFNADKNGNVLWSDDYLTANSEKLFKNSKGRTTGLIGIYSVTETKAPKGLARDEKTVYIKIEQNGNGIKTTFSESKVFDNTKVVAEDGTAWEQEEKTQKINIKIQKKDAETGEAKPQGYGTFAGAKFNVWLYDPLQLMDVLVGTIITNENGTGELVKLAPGLYTIEEIEAPAGYNKNTSKVKIEARVKEPNTAYFDYIATIAEKPITVTIDKTSTNEVGAKVSVKGAVLALYNSKDEKIEEWTTTGRIHTFKGLAKGDYVIKEVQAPKGYLPLEEEYRFTVKETEEVQKHDIFNEPIPEIKSIATFDTGAKESLPNEEVTVNDKFELKKLRKDFPYELRAKLVEKDNVSNVIAEDNKKFTAEDYKGEETLKFTFNAKELEGKRLVVLTELHRLNRKGSTLVAVHKDINNIDETVVFPKIKTTATDKKDGGKDLFAGEKETVKDKVSYFNLIIGRVYKVMGRLVDAETGEPILDNGKEVTAEKEFTAKESNGFVELEFTFDARALAGKTVVLFEDVYQDKIKIATHTDITDKEQSIYIPKITTKLTGKDSDKKKFHAREKIRLTDTMEYENFVKGSVYYAKGEVVNYKTGKVIKRSEGNFIADEKNGEASLDFTINAKGLEGARLVCFEEIYTVDENGNPDKLVASHKDINDENQSVRIYNIGKITISDKDKFKRFSVLTGDSNEPVYYLIGILVLGMVAVLIKRRKIEK